MGAPTEVASAPDATTPARVDIASELPATGETIGRFEVLEVLGRGGMGVVVAARDPRLHRRVAIKLVRAGAAGSDGDNVKERLLREARAMARLRHPNVVAVHEVGEHRGQVYVAMEELRGGTLRQAAGRLRGGRDWRQLVALFAEAGRGLAAAHASGLVHRDFKPDNVFLDRDGRVRVGDFGLARAAGATALASPSEDASLFDSLTRADEVLGTPAYMAPEQLTGAIDARTDQFAFCVALYEALYGRLPFEGDTHLAYFEAMHAGAVQPPDPSQKVPRWLFEVLRRGLSCDPDERYPSMNELLIELGADPEQAHRAGQLQRTLLVIAGTTFAALWAPTVLSLDLAITYRLHYITDISFLTVVVLGGLWARESLARSRFNRGVYGLGATCAVAMVSLTAGGDLLGIPPEVAGALHLLVAGSATLGAATTLDGRISVIAVTYFAAFFASARWPSIFLPACVLSHAIMAVGAVIIFRMRARTAQGS